MGIVRYLREGEILKGTSDETKHSLTPDGPERDRDGYHLPSKAEMPSLTGSS